MAHAGAVAEELVGPRPVVALHPCLEAGGPCGPGQLTQQLSVDLLLSPVCEPDGGCAVLVEPSLANRGDERLARPLCLPGAHLAILHLGPRGPCRRGCR